MNEGRVQTCSTSELTWDAAESVCPEHTQAKWHAKKMTKIKYIHLPSYILLDARHNEMLHPPKKITHFHDSNIYDLHPRRHSIGYKAHHPRYKVVSGVPAYSRPLSWSEELQSISRHGHVTHNIFSSWKQVHVLRLKRCVNVKLSTSTGDCAGPRRAE